MYTKGSPVTAEQIVFGLRLLPVVCLFLPRPVPGPSCPFRARGCCYVVDFISNFRQHSPQQENQESKHFIKLKKKKP